MTQTIQLGEILAIEQNSQTTEIELNKASMNNKKENKKYTENKKDEKKQT